MNDNISSNNILRSLKNEALDIKHQSLLKERLYTLGDCLSEYCFSNLCLFRKVHNYHIHYNDSEQIFVSGETYDGFSYLMPVFDLRKRDAPYLADVIKGFDCFFPIAKSALSYFDPAVFSISFNIDDSDYVYSADKLKSYQGRKLSAKRNLMKQFRENRSIDCSPLGEDTKKDAMDILQSWQRDVKKPESDTDYFPCVEALARIEALDLFGFVYYADGEPSGFLIAGEASPGMCVFHFAKGKRKFKGVFQHMFNHFANTYDERFKLYNFEQDLGKANFRKTKQSYNPDRLLNKYRIRLL